MKLPTVGQALPLIVGLQELALQVEKLTAERDAAVKRETFATVANSDLQGRVRALEAMLDACRSGLTTRAMKAERERDEARALVRSALTICCCGAAQKESKR